MRGFRSRFLFLAGVGLLSLGAPGSSFGFAFLDSHWLTSTVPIRLQLGSSEVPLVDGSPSYDLAVENALLLWNEQIAGTQFTWTVVPSGTGASMGDGVNSMQLSSTVYGDKFGADVLATTVIGNVGGQTTETDVLFNKAQTVNSYYGAAFLSGVTGQIDIHRVALHELGHVLGLDHPDENNQAVIAIMNAHISLLDDLQADDIAGGVALYGAPPNPPAPTGNGRLGQISTRGSVGTGDSVMIGGFIIPGPATKTVLLRAIGPSLGKLGVSGALANPVLALHDEGGAVIGTNDDWRSDQEQEILATKLAPGNDLESAILTELAPGNYTAIVSGANAGSGIALVEVYDLTPDTGKLGNISTRAMVGVNQDDVLIGGFIVVGPQSQELVVRAIGPSLQNVGVPNPLQNPYLAIYNSNGDVFRSNDNFGTDPAADSVRDEGLAPKNFQESAIYFEAAPGNYTAIVSSVNHLPGIGLIEVYGVN
jgi:hypothetical protein